MRKASAYEALARELERWRSMPARELAESIGKPACVQSVYIEGEEIALEVTVRWHDRERSAVRITAVANGPSHWRLERLEESIVIRAGSAGL